MISVSVPGACPGIRKGGGPKSENFFFWLFNFSGGGGAAQKIAEKMIGYYIVYEPFRKKGLHFLHLNAGSLLSKLSDVRLLVNNSKAAVLAVSETWLDGSVTDAEIELVGYTVVRKDRNRNGGGVCLYVTVC